MDLKEALSQLDSSNDDHWVSDGRPRLDVVKTLTGNSELKRDDLPSDFTREETTVSEAIEIETPKDLTDEEILEAEPRDLGTDIPAIEKWMAACTNKMNDLDKQRNHIDREVALWNGRLQMVTRVYERTKKQKNVGSTQTAIKDFLNAQRQAREERIERAREFMKSGTSARAVFEQLAKGSKLDQALSQRKATPGSTRPDPRMPVRR